MSSTMKGINNKGFTLIELAIVLVIISFIGLLVLKGSSLIPSAQTKDLIKIKQDLTIAVAEFKDRYHYFPGDLPLAGTGANGSNIPNISDSCNFAIAGTTIGNGRIDTDDEIDCVTEHLFRAGFIEAEAGFTDDGTDLPTIKRLYDAEITIQVKHRSASSFSSSSTYPASIEHIVEYENIPLEAARRIDSTLDDGDLNDGNVQAISPAAEEVGEGEVAIAPILILAVPL